MDTHIKYLYILLSEDETHIKKDVDNIIFNSILTEEEISVGGDSLLVCISRDYLDITNETPALMVRDQLSTVFCPRWRTCSAYYSTLVPLMNLDGDKHPKITVMTYNKEIYDNMDYYLHLSKFDNKFKILLNKDTKRSSSIAKMIEPITSQVSREDVLELGEMSVKILEMAGYDDDENNQVPGWIFQSSNIWLTRVLDIFDIEPHMNLLPEPIQELTLLTREDYEKSILTPIILGSHLIGEDIRTCIVESFEVRKELYELMKTLLKQI